jgi:lipopolysaccharide transport system permease protein
MKPIYSIETASADAAAGMSLYARPEDRFNRAIYLRDLFVALVRRELKLMYKRSALGIAWSLIMPLVQLLILSAIFRTALAVKIPSYASYVFSGLLIWSWFQTSLIKAAVMIVDNRSMIIQPQFPRGILPVASAATWAVHFLLAFPVFFLFLKLDGIKLTTAIWYFPLLFLVQFVLTLTLAFPIASINVAFRDAQYIVMVLLQLLFFATPIFYSPAGVAGIGQLVMVFNPIAQIIAGYRAVFIQGTSPDLLGLVCILAASISILPLSYWIFEKQSKRFAEEL